MTGCRRRPAARRTVPGWRDGCWDRALFILSALVSFAFGAVLWARPGVGAITLALLFGLYSLIYGGSMFVQGIELRRTGKTVHAVLTERRAA